MKIVNQTICLIIGRLSMCLPDANSNLLDEINNIIILRKYATLSKNATLKCFPIQIIFKMANHIQYFVHAHVIKIKLVQFIH